MYRKIDINNVRLNSLLRAEYFVYLAKADKHFRLKRMGDIFTEEDLQKYKSVSLVFDEEKKITIDNEVTKLNSIREILMMDNYPDYEKLRAIRIELHDWAFQVFNGDFSKIRTVPFFVELLLGGVNEFLLKKARESSYEIAHRNLLLASLYVVFILLIGQTDLKMLQTSFEMIFRSDLAIKSSTSRKLVEALLEDKIDTDDFSELEKNELLLHGQNALNDPDIGALSNSKFARDFMLRHHFKCENDVNLFSVDELIWVYDLLSNWIGSNYYLESEVNLAPIFTKKIPNFYMGKINNVYDFLQRK